MDNSIGEFYESEEILDFDNVDLYLEIGNRNTSVKGSLYYLPSWYSSIDYRTSKISLLYLGSSIYNLYFVSRVCEDYRCHFVS